MSEQAEQDRTRLRNWAQAGGKHDRLIALLRKVLPAAIGVVAALMLAVPLTLNVDLSFVVAKDRVAMARERLRVAEAAYRGEDSKGQAFVIRAGSAVQVSSRDPVVKLNDLTAEIRLGSGPATIAANQARYDMESERVAVDGPVRFQTNDGYRLDTRDVIIDLKTRRLGSDRPVSGRMPLGSFTGNRMRADLAARTVVLAGRAHLRIIQGQGRGRA
jgi:lipopolysaccharide export system protein LptC